MIWFWTVAGLLILVALAALLRPLIWRAGLGAGEGEAAVAMFRRQLAEIDAELAQGRLAPEAAAARAGAATFRPGARPPTAPGPPFRYL